MAFNVSALRLPLIRRVGSSYGVRKLATDPPHWLSNGY